MFNPRWLQGKTVLTVEMNPEKDGRGGTYYKPRITFTDGSRITFNTKETEAGEYGTEINFHKSEWKK